jgi:hypothetical protein
MTRSTKLRLRKLQASGAPSGLIRVQEIILEAVDLLQSSSKVKWDEEQCDADVRRFIDDIWNSKPPSRDLPQERKQLCAAIRGLEKADSAIEKITSENSIYKKLQENHIHPALEATRLPHAHKIQKWSKKALSGDTQKADDGGERQHTHPAMDGCRADTKR